MFMCASHWRRLPTQHRNAIWATYIPGQENRKDPTPQYMVVQAEAVLAMAIIDGVDADALSVQRARVDRWKRIVERLCIENTQLAPGRLEVSTS
jgi:hypothetical protein